MTLVEKINSLINYSNEVTGNSDADLTTAVQSLGDGYGGGGGGGTRENWTTRVSINLVHAAGFWRFYANEITKENGVDVISSTNLNGYSYGMDQRSEYDSELIYANTTAAIGDYVDVQAKASFDYEYYSESDGVRSSGTLSSGDTIRLVNNLINSKTYLTLIIKGGN